MKKLIVLLLSLSFMAGLAAAASFTEIGHIDVQKVFTQYKATEKAQKELTKHEKEYATALEKSQKELENAIKAGKTTKEVTALSKKLEKDLAPKQKTLMQLNQQLTGKLQKEILTAVQNVAKKVGIEVVLDKQVVITGGMDLTEMVINELNK